MELMEYLIQTFYLQEILMNITFADAGSFDYYCILHPWMIGTVNVE